MRTLSICPRPMFVMAAIAISTAAAASAQYTFVTLSVPNAIQTVAVGISNENLVVGYYSTSSATYGFSYSPTTQTWKYPINFPNGYVTKALAANSVGTIVGTYLTSPVSSFFGMVDQGGGYSAFNEPGCSGTQITGINDYPTMTGVCTTPNPSGPPIQEAWVGSPWNTTFTCEFATGTVPAAINNWGIVGGSYSYGSSESPGLSGFVSPPQGGCEPVVYPGATYTQVGGLNDLGTISGSYSLAPYGESGSWQGFVEVGSVFSTVDAPNTDSTFLGQVNNNGWIVGSYIVNNTPYAFYAEPTVFRRHPTGYDGAKSVLVDPGN